MTFFLWFLVMGSVVTGISAVTVSTMKPDPATLRQFNPEFLRLSILKNTTVCCGELGCFDSGGAFHDFLKRPGYTTPSCMLTDWLKLYLNTRENPDPRETQILRNRTVATSNFQAEKKTILIIHGYQDFYQWGWWQTMVTELLIEGDYNVIRLDWSAGNKIPYAQAVANIRLVGAYAANFLLNLKDQYGLDPKNIHLVGHSLGAHAAGYIGSIMKGRGALVGRITGLDPAGPFFTDTSPEVQLNPEDAAFVDTIITDGESIFDLAFGSPQAMGHINFYPNGGKRQPGCEGRGIFYRLKNGLTQNATSYDALEIVGALGLEAYACSHARSVALFAESINTRACGMQAFECNDYKKFLRGECFTCVKNKCATFGYHVNKSLADPENHPKKFYTITNDKSSFCTNTYRVLFSIQRKNRTNDSETKFGSVYITLIGTQGKSEKRLLNEDQFSLKPGQTYSYFMETQKDIGDLRSVIFYWDYQENLLRLSDYIETQYIWLAGEIVVTDTLNVVSTFSPSKYKVKENTDLVATLTSLNKESLF